MRLVDFAVWVVTMLVLFGGFIVLHETSHQQTAEYFGCVGTNITWWAGFNNGTFAYTQSDCSRLPGEVHLAKITVDAQTESLSNMVGWPICFLLMGLVTKQILGGDDEQ